MQHAPIVFYLEDYALSEQESLARLGLKTNRDTLLSLSSKEHHTFDFHDVEAIIRGPKLKPSTYEELCRLLSTHGISSRTSPTSFEALSNSDIYELPIQEHVPEMRSMDFTSHSLVDDILGLSEWGQIFIRSELGSATKSVGIDNCMINQFSSDEIKNKIDLLKQAHPNAEKLVARRVVNVRKIDGKSIEGRFVVLSGKVRYLDHFELDNQVEKDGFKFRNWEPADLVTQKLSHSGISGDYFLDIAEKQNGGWFVVEIKPLLNGTVRNTGLLASSLLCAN